MCYELQNNYETLGSPFKNKKKSKMYGRAQYVITDSDY